MKTATIELTRHEIDTLLDRAVDTNDPNFKREEAAVHMAGTVFNTMLKPMEIKKGADLNFLYAFVKIKDAIIDCVKRIPENNAAWQFQLDESNYKVLLTTFQEFNDWNPTLAHVILLSSEVLQRAKVEGTANEQR